MEEHLATLAKLDAAEPSPAEVAAVLEAARTYLLEVGWTQDTTGAPGAPRCLVGAVSEQAANYAVEHHSAIGFSMCVYPMEALRRALGLRRPEHLPRWNDHPERTLGDVVDLLETTAKRVRAGEIDYT